MLIRKTATRNKPGGEPYVTFRLVAAERTGKQVRQVTLLNLGRQFDLPQPDWPRLCTRIEAILAGQPDLLAEAEAIETHAQRYAVRLIAAVRTPAIRQPAPPPVSPTAAGPVFAEVDVASLQLVQPRSVGVEAAGLAAIGWLGLDQTLAGLGFNRVQRTTAAASLIGRMAAPGSELATWRWLGSAARNPQAARARSKEKRSDCPLVTLGLVLDASGFVRRSRVFAGNVAEATTLQDMLEGLATPKGALVIMDAGIAATANIAWLKQHEYRYLVVSRERTRQFDSDQAVTTLTASDETIQLQRVLNEDGTEVRLYCHSTGREAKVTAMTGRFAARFEAGLAKLAAGLSRPRAQKGPAAVRQRIGRLQAQSRSIARHYDVTVTQDESGTNATAIAWTKTPVAGSMLTHPGVSCLRSNETSWDAARLWHSYIMLTDLEAVFRRLKSELSLRPVFHHTKTRTEGHLFITVLAYQLVQAIRRKLADAGETMSWSCLRKVLSVQQRVTATFRQRDGRTLHVRKATLAEPALRRVYNTLGIDAAPGGVRKLVV